LLLRFLSFTAFTEVSTCKALAFNGLVPRAIKLKRWPGVLLIKHTKNLKKCVLFIKWLPNKERIATHICFSTFVVHIYRI